MIKFVQVYSLPNQNLLILLETVSREMDQPAMIPTKILTGLAIKRKSEESITPFVHKRGESPFKTQGRPPKNRFVLSPKGTHVLKMFS